MKIERHFKLGGDASTFFIDKEKLILHAHPCHALMEWPCICELERDDNVFCTVNVAPLIALICRSEALGVRFGKRAAMTIPSRSGDRTIDTKQSAFICDASNCAVWSKPVPPSQTVAVLRPHFPIGIPTYRDLQKGSDPGVAR